MMASSKFYPQSLRIRLLFSMQHFRTNQQLCFLFSVVVHSMRKVKNKNYETQKCSHEIKTKCQPTIQWKNEKLNNNWKEMVLVGISMSLNFDKSCSLSKSFSTSTKLCHSMNFGVTCEKGLIIYAWTCFFHTWTLYALDDKNIRNSKKKNVTCVFALKTEYDLEQMIWLN